MKAQTEHEFRGRFGKMVKGVSSLLLSEDQLSDTQNMQPGYGWRQRRGMSALTASAVATGLRFKSMVQFRDLRGNTDVILAHTYDSVNGDRIMEASALPPNAITWSEKTTLTAGGEICQFGITSGAILIANDKDFLIWRGNESLPTGIFFYDDSSNKYINYWEEVTDASSATSIPLQNMTNADEVNVVSEMPLDTISLDFGTFNTDDGVISLYYWGSAWTEILKFNSGGTDGTRSTGADLDIDCSSIAAWGDADTGTGVSSQVVYEGRECFKFSVPSGIGVAKRTLDLGSFDTGCSLTWRQKIVSIGDTTSNMFAVWVATLTGRPTMRFFSPSEVNWQTGGELGTDELKIGEWQEFTIDCASALATNDTWIDGVKLEDDQAHFTTTPSTNGQISFRGSAVSALIPCEVYVEIVKCSIGAGTVEVFPTYIDGTEVSDVQWAQDGDVSITSLPTDITQTSVENVPGFAYKFVVDEFTVTAAATIEEVAVHAPMAEMENVWFGQDTFPTGCYVYNGTDFTDYTAYVNNNLEAQFADLSAATTSWALYVGFAQRQSQIIFYPAGVAKNAANAQIDALEYADNSGAFVSVGTFVDKTLDVALDSSFSQKGALQWVPPAEEDEKATTIAGDTTPMFWYKIEWDATLSDPTNIYLIRGVPHPETVDSSYGVFGHKMRAWQIAPIRNENAVRYSASGLPNVWNGLDSGYMYFGERPLLAGTTYYNEAVVFADSEIWMIKGTSPSTFSRLRLSEKVGISAPRSLVNIESGVVISDSIRNILAWFYNDGIWMFDNAKIWKISAPDIDSFFDPDHPDYINPAYLDQTYGEYDFDLQIAKWIVYSGATATTPTKMIVMHFPSMWFGIFDYGTDVSSILSVLNNRYYTVAGGFDNGKFYLLNDGITDVDTSGNTVAVDAYVVTRDQFLGFSEGMRERLMSIWTESKEAGGLMELDEYPDGSKTPQNIAKQSMTFLGKIYGALQRTLRLWDKQKTTKFRIRNRSKNSRMILLGHSTTVDRGRADE